MTDWLPKNAAEWAMVVQAVSLVVSLAYAKGALREASNARQPVVMLMQQQ